MSRPGGPETALVECGRPAVFRGTTKTPLLYCGACAAVVRRHFHLVPLPTEAAV